VIIVVDGSARLAAREATTDAVVVVVVVVSTPRAIAREESARRAPRRRNMGTGDARRCETSTSDGDATGVGEPRAVVARGDAEWSRIGR
jgi:hypothetical protein